MNVAVTVVAAVVVLMVIAALACIPGLQLGTVPAWISATGTVATFGSAAVALIAYRRQQRVVEEERDCCTIG